MSERKITEKFTYEYVKDYFEKQNCVLLESEYRNCNTPLHYICYCGRQAMIRFRHFMRGTRCSKCAYEMLSKRFSGEGSPSWNPNRDEAKLFKCIRRKYARMARRMLDQKTSKSEQILGYTCKELRQHLTNHPNWDRVKDSKWVIDHIFPIKAFLKHNIFNLRLMHGLDNLQPLLQSENSVKHDKYDLELFKKWLALKGIII